MNKPSASRISGTRALVWSLGVFLGCSPAVRWEGGEAEEREEEPPADGGWMPRPDGPPPPPIVCTGVLTPAGAEAVLTPEFAVHYTAYDLGPVPGVPDHLGGAVIKRGDDSTLLIVGASEATNSAIYSIKVKRDNCGHIFAFDGRAKLEAYAPYADANLLHAPKNLIIYTEWPIYGFGQLPDTATSPARRIDLTTRGMATEGGSAGGLGFVPPSIPAAAGELRLVTWPSGHWYHMKLVPSGSLFDVADLRRILELPGGAGGFAYIPAGSRGFMRQSLIISEWDADQVSVYEVDASGDPIQGTRRPFFTKFPKPWGAYFEPVTGDYMFLTWGPAPDRVYIVQGFVPPPPIP